MKTLKEETNRIKEMMGIDEQSHRNYLFRTGNINWYSVSSDARYSVEHAIEKEYGTDVPREVYQYLWKMFPSTDSTFYKSLITDIKNGTLSKTTSIEFKNHMKNYLDSLTKNKEITDTILKNSNPEDLSKVKSPLLRPVVNLYLNKFYDMVIPSYFINGMISSINGLQKKDLRIASNSNKIIRQLSSSIQKDSQFRDVINNIVKTYLLSL